MGNDIIYNDNVATPGQVLKITALIYLKEALVKQQYEACPELITNAKRYGARQSEIRKVIVEHLAGNGKGRRTRTDQKYGGRLRYY